MTPPTHDLSTDLLKLAQDEVKLDDDIAVRDTDRLKVHTDETKVHTDEQAAGTAARNVVNADRALAEATARVQAQQQVLAAAQAAGDVDEINLAKQHLAGAQIDRSSAQFDSDRAHTALDKAATALKTDTDALHADQDKLAKDEAQVDKDGREVAADENHVNHDLGLPEGTPIDGAPELDGHGGVVEPGHIVVTDPIVVGPPIDDWPTTHGPHDPILVHETVHPEGDPLDPAPVGDPGTAPTDDPDPGYSPHPVLAHDPDPGYTRPAHDVDPGYSPDHEVFAHPTTSDDDTGRTPEHTTTTAHEPSSATHEPVESVSPVEHESTGTSGSHEDAGHAEAAADHTSDAGHADAAALHHG